jgi:hypothetical protein
MKKLKLKKIEIIEEGRICSQEELNRIKGGTCSSPAYTSCQSGYLTCNQLGYVSCTPVPSMSGYEHSGSGTFCDSGYVYNQCIIGESVYWTCISNNTYNTFPG